MTLLRHCSRHGTDVIFHVDPFSFTYIRVSDDGVRVWLVLRVQVLHFFLIRLFFFFLHNHEPYYFNPGLIWSLERSHWSRQCSLMNVNLQGRETVQVTSLTHSDYSLNYQKEVFRHLARTINNKRYLYKKFDYIFNQSRYLL